MESKRVYDTGADRIIIKRHQLVNTSDVTFTIAVGTRSMEAINLKTLTALGSVCTTVAEHESELKPDGPSDVR